MFGGVRESKRCTSLFILFILLLCLRNTEALKTKYERFLFFVAFIIIINFLVLISNLIQSAVMATSYNATSLSSIWVTLQEVLRFLLHSK